MIDILFFGRVADLIGQRRTSLSLPAEGLSLFTLRDQLFRPFDTSLRMSINQTLVSEDRPLSDGDEVAFFSVFSGG